MNAPTATFETNQEVGAPPLREIVWGAFYGPGVSRPAIRLNKF